MARSQLRVRIDSVGALEVIDPGFDTLDLLRSVTAGFAVRQAPLPGFSSPRLLTTRHAQTGVRRNVLRSLSAPTLWSIHGAVLADLKSAEEPGTATISDAASLFDVKLELARRILMQCHLCAHRCGVDRTRGELGRCGLGEDAIVAEHFVHIAEESPINPSLIVSLAGCGLRCRGCQQWAILKPQRVQGVVLEPTLWDELDKAGARSLSFVGGNPDESLYAILCFLEAAPLDWPLPIVWNNHAYCDPKVLQLLRGIVDAYVPDLKHDAEDCARAYTRVNSYPDLARESIALMLSQNVPVIVRILVLPGHIECCHLPSVAWLAEQRADNLLVSVRGQYSPDWLITEEGGPLARRPTAGETATVQDEAVRRGLHVIE